MLGSVLLNVFINDLYDGTECTINKFADNAELGRAVNMLDVRAALQRDLNELKKRTDGNFIENDKSKCKFLHLGWNKPMQPRWAGANCLGRSSAEQDLKTHVNAFIQISRVPWDQRRLAASWAVSV